MFNNNRSKTGLVLSGGGTRGVAHAGALKFLAEKSIKIDCMACCSAGSIVGAMHALNKTPEEILEFFKSVYFFHWSHFAFNKPGFVSSVIFANYLQPVFGDMKIGDFNIDIKIIATELISGNQKVFGPETKVTDAIIASCSIPGITVPYAMGDELYSDGGVLNNFPADIIHEHCSQLIGVYVSPPQDIKPGDLKTIRSVTTRAYELLSHRTEIYKFNYCDWLITSPELSNYGTFERKAKRLEEIYTIGYEAAKRSYDPEVFSN